jgi:hypothetical protein
MTRHHLIAVVATVALAIAAIASAQRPIKNYFAACSATAGACDNVLTIGGTWRIGATSVTATAATLNNSPQTVTSGSPVSGKKVAYGQQTTVAASDTVVTGLATVTACVASLESDPADDPEWTTCAVGDQAGTPAAGSILVKTWKNTGGTDPTPVAATTFSKKVNWIAWGQ